MLTVPPQWLLKLTNVFNELSTTFFFFFGTLSLLTFIRYTTYPLYGKNNTSYPCNMLFTHTTLCAINFL